MSLFGGGDNGGGHVHHHGLFAGLSAATAAVISILALALLLARHIMTTVLGDAMLVFLALLIAGGLGGVVLWYRLVWHKHRMFSATAASAAAAVPVRAEVVTGAPVAIPLAPRAEVAVSAVPALEPARELHVHLPEGMDPGEIAAVLGRLRAGEHRELERGE
jgi:hypothetical protein